MGCGTSKEGSPAWKEKQTTWVGDNEEANSKRQAEEAETEVPNQKPARKNSGVAVSANDHVAVDTEVSSSQAVQRQSPAFAAQATGKGEATMPGTAEEGKRGADHASTKCSDVQSRAALHKDIQQSAALKKEQALSSLACEKYRTTSPPGNMEFEYTGAPLPSNEEERYQVMCGLELLDTKPEDRFDDITRLLCQIFHVPVAIVSLVKKDRQWFKSVQGLPVTSTERRASFCAWTLLPQHPEVLVVPDALEDIRFAENPLVLNEPHIRFYAGAPLVTSTGYRLGSLCIIDRMPRELEAESCNVLINFAEIVARELEKEKMRAEETARIKGKADSLLRAFEAFKEGVMVCDSSSGELNILFFNETWSKMTGIERSALGSSVWDHFQLNEKKEKMITLSRNAVEAQKPFSVDVMGHMSDGSAVRLTASFRPATSEGLDQYTPAVAIPGSMASTKEDGVTDNLYFCTMVQTYVTSASSVTSSSSSLHFRDEPSLRPDHPFKDVQLGPLLGQGSFGKVFRGLWNGAQVAVKIIQPPVPSRSSHTGSIDSTATSSTSSHKAALECLLTAQLSHPNIVTTYKSALVPIVAEGSGKAGAHETWLVLEYCDQGTLQYAIERGKFDQGFITAGRHSRQPHIPAIKRTAQEIASAMAYIHAKDILHGDLCGGNILLTASGRDERGFVAKVADFGLARLLDAEAIMTQTYGTVTHMPPELLTQGQLVKAADSYAWGAILWELFTGNCPWAGMLPMQVIYHVTILGKSLKFPDSTPEGFRSLGEACLSADPSKRPSFLEILDTLDRM